MKRKRLFIEKKTSVKQRIEIVKWAATNNYDAVVFPLTMLKKTNEKSEYIKLARKYELFIEAGGHELSELLPRKMFFFHRELFRMERGKRKKNHHFCTTNPQTTAIIKENASQLFARSMQLVTPPRIFHLFPDKEFENIWCSCPACRAFSPAEQNIISINCAADALLKLDPDARLGYFHYTETPETPGIAPRKNMARTPA